MKRTVVTVPNGMRIIITEKSNPHIVMLFQKAFEKLNKEHKCDN